MNIPRKTDSYSGMRDEYVEMLEGQIAKSNNGIVRTALCVKPSVHPADTVLVHLPVGKGLLGGLGPGRFPHKVLNATGAALQN